MSVYKCVWMAVVMGMFFAPMAGATNFALLLDSDAGGDGKEVDGVESIYIDDIIIGVSAAQSKKDVPNRVWRKAQEFGYRVYGPGDAHYGSITIQCRVTSTGADDLYAWWLDASRGQNIRKNISVIALNRDGSEARRWNLIDSFPVRWDPGEYSPSSNRNREEPVVVLEAQIGSVELVPGAEVPQQRPTHNVIVKGGKNAPAPTEDFSFSDFADGEPCIHLSLLDSSVGSDQFHQTTPGHKSVQVFSLGGEVTSGRKDMCEWINATVAGKPWKRSVTVKEILKDGAAGKTAEFLDCFPTRYVFPAFSASGTGNLYEEINVKPTRLELQARQAN